MRVITFVTACENKLERDLLAQLSNLYLLQTKFLSGIRIHSRFKMYSSKMSRAFQWQQFSVVFGYMP